MGGAWKNRQRWVVVLGLGSLVVACGKTARNPGGSATTVDVGGDAAGAPGAAGAPNVDPLLPAPNCAISLDGNTGRHCAAYQDGSVWCWGAGSGYGPHNFEPSATPAQVQGLAQVERVVLGSDHSCAIDAAGAVWCWGDNGHRQVADLPDTELPPTQTSILTGDAPLKGLGLSEGQTCAVDVISHVYCRGKDLSGKSAAPRMVDVAGEPDTTMPGHSNHVIDDHGRVFQLDDFSKPERLDLFGTDNAWYGRGGPEACVLKRWGSLWCTGYTSEPADSALLAKRELDESVVQAGTGTKFVCALTDAGQVWCEGENSVGQTGTIAASAATGGSFLDLPNVRQISVNSDSACALEQDGSVWCWGAYAEGAGAGPTLVSGCAGQTRAPAPAGHFKSAPRHDSERFAEASSARNQALCECEHPDAPQACVADRGTSPNPACLDALAPDASSTWSCLADDAWKRIACLRKTACDATQLDSCPEPSCRFPATLEPVWKYCQRGACVTAPDVTLRSEQICDGKPDCVDGSDELNCSAAGFFKCNDGTALKLERLCDQTADCPDGADEMFCP